MDLFNLVAHLRNTGYPVAFASFEQPNPKLPYIVYTTPNDPDFKADNKNYHKIIDVDIELYTDKKDLEAEAVIENLLEENELPYASGQAYIESERMHMKRYEIRLI